MTGIKAFVLKSKQHLFAVCLINIFLGRESGYLSENVPICPKYGESMMFLALLVVKILVFCSPIQKFGQYLSECGKMLNVLYNVLHNFCSRANF